MIGLGKWQFQIDTMVFRGKGLLTVADDGGAYGISIELENMDMPEIFFSGVQAEGDTLTGIARTDLLKGKDVPFSVTFTGESAVGFLKVPFLGKIRLKDGRKIA